ncbi:hypothetical protein MBLNU230_g7154t1 [Neophaeotheca triangularis]
MTLAAARNNEEATAPMDSVTPIYTPLENKGMIRVCEIAREPYTCLSYTWGSMANSCSITLNQHPFSIGRNLFRLLRRLRCRGAVSIWIDALCIDQSNHAEKSVQVAQMGAIYSKAEKVFIWLGEDCEGEGTEDPSVYHPQCGHTDSSNIPKFDFVLLTTMFEYIAAGCHYYEIPGIFHLLPDGLACCNPRRAIQSLSLALHRFYESQWFSRTWTIQELALQPNAEVLIGGSSVRWSTINDVRCALKLHHTGCCGVFGDASGSSNNFSRETEIVEKLLRLRFKFDELDWFGVARGLLADLSRPSEARLRYLTWLIDRGSRQCASDPRDKIFAFFGIGGPTFEGFTPSYNATAVECYKSFTLWLIQGTRSLDVWDFLAFDANKGRNPDLRGLPSWAIDWTLQGRRAVVKEQPYRTDKLSLNCAPGVAATADVQADGTLAVRGIHIDSVHLVSTRSWSDRSQRNELPLVILEWTEFATSTQALGHETGAYTSAMDALFRVATSDSIPLKKGLVGNLPTGDSSKWRRAAAEDRATWSEWASRLQDDAWLNNESKNGGAHTLHPKRTDHDETPDWQIEDAVSVAAENRRLFATEGSRLGLGALCIEPGDEIFLLQGASNPYVLRESSDKKHSSGQKTYAIVGACYVDGVMDGELKDMLESADTVYLC